MPFDNKNWFMFDILAQIVYRLKYLAPEMDLSRDPMKVHTRPFTFSKKESIPPIREFLDEFYLVYLTVCVA